MKLVPVADSSLSPPSPSMRREWIEMSSVKRAVVTAASLPPCGGSGLKWDCQPLCQTYSLSPSMRREWIEMPYQDPTFSP